MRLGRKAPSDKPALKPYWGKLAVRNFRGGAGNVMQGWLSFATPLERVDTLETTDLHVGAPVLYSMKSDVEDGNLSLESRGFDSLPVETNHQLEASLACECGNALLEA